MIQIEFIKEIGTETRIYNVLKNDEEIGDIEAVFDGGELSYTDSENGFSMEDDFYDDVIELLEKEAKILFELENKETPIEEMTEEELREEVRQMRYTISFKESQINNLYHKLNRR